QSSQSAETRRCVLETIPYSLSRHLTMILEGIERLRRQCIDRVSTDEVLNIKNIRIGGILGACTGPERPLNASASLAQGDKPLALKNLEEAVVNHLGIRNSDLAEQRLRLRLRGCESLEGTIHHGVHPTDEERGNRSDLRRIGTAPEAANVGPRHSLIVTHGEHQSNVDVLPLGDELFDGRNSFGSRRDFNHDVGPCHRSPQTFRLLDSALGVMGQMRRDLEADVTVGAVGLVINNAENIRRHLNVLDGQSFVKIPHIRLWVLCQQCAQRVIVIGAAGDGFLENGWIAGDAANAVLFNQPLQLAGANEIAPNVIEPNGLSLCESFFQRVHDVPPYNAFTYIGRAS